jgi:hypothetical protein
MNRNIQIKERMELALRPAELPTIEEMLEQVSRRGVLRGPVDWVFPAWMLYVEYATQRIIETFPLSEEEKRQLFHFRDTMKQLLLKAWMQAKEKLTALYKAVVEGTYRIEKNRLYAPEGVWIYMSRITSRFKIHGVSAKAYFPDLLKLREKLELFQLGWRASDESEVDGEPVMITTQPWQVFAWAAARYGELYIRVDSANLTSEGISVSVYLTANSWRQRWSKEEAIDLVASYLRHGEWAPLLTMWLGDGEARQRKALRGEYQLIIAAKEPWRLGKRISAREALVASGREAFAKFREAAGAYGMLLDLLKAHKWIAIKLATDKDFRVAYKLKAKKRSIDRLRKAYRQNNGETPTVSHTKTNKPGAVVVAGVMMYLELKSGRGGSLVAKHYVRDVGKALTVAERLESVGLRPNVVRSGPYYVVYITTADLLKLAEKDEAIRRAIALYLAEKAKSGTLRQREIAEKILKRHPLFSYPPNRLTAFSKLVLPCISRRFFKSVTGNNLAVIYSWG